METKCEESMCILKYLKRHCWPCDIIKNNPDEVKRVTTTRSQLSALHTHGQLYLPLTAGFCAKISQILVTIFFLELKVFN